MLIDARKLSEGEHLRADVCIVGAGPAGIAIAKELNHTSLKVLLLESGGFEVDEKVNDLSRGSKQGESYPAPSDLRERGFGGTAQVWPIVLDQNRLGVRYVPFDPIDFEKRDWIPYSGWPITRTDLDPYYARAHGLAKTGPYTYDVQDWDGPDAQAIQFPGGQLTTQMFQFGPREVFTRDYRYELEQSANVSIVIYAHALEINTDNLGQRVTGLKVGTVAGNRFEVTARMVVLAQGGLEVPRLLLLSQSAQTCGLGNGHDLVGRFLMDHPVVRPGVLVPDNREVFNRLALYDARWVNGARVLAKPVLTAETQRQEKLININTALFPRPAWARHNLLRRVFPKGQRVVSPALQSAQVLKRSLQKGKLPKDPLQHLANLLLGVDDLVYKSWRQLGKYQFGQLPGFTYDFDRGGWSQLDNLPRRFGCFDLLHVTEQTPDPTNRVQLADNRDRFGYQRMVVDWRHSDFDRHNIKLLGHENHGPRV